jgi:hypothetical protein
MNRSIQKHEEVHYVSVPTNYGIIFVMGVVSVVLLVTEVSPERIIGRSADGSQTESPPGFVQTAV